MGNNINFLPNYKRNLDQTQTIAETWVYHLVGPAPAGRIIRVWYIVCWVGGPRQHPWLKSQSPADETGDWNMEHYLSGAKGARDCGVVLTSWLQVKT